MTSDTFLNGDDLFEDWREDVLNGSPPKRYEFGGEELNHFRLRPETFVLIGGEYLGMLIPPGANGGMELGTFSRVHTIDGCTEAPEDYRHNLCPQNPPPQEPPAISDQFFDYVHRSLEGGAQ